MPQLRITDYFRPLNEPGPSSPAPAPAPARAPRPARGGPVAPELQARAPRPYSTETLNRDHARVDLGSKFAAFSERMRREQTPPAPTPAPAYVLSHLTQPAPARAVEPSPATPPEPLFILSHMTQPAPPAAAEPSPATPPAPLFILSHLTQPAPPAAAAPSPATPPAPLFVLSHMAQTHAPQQPLYDFNHNPHPVYDDPFGRHNRHLYFAGRMTNLLTGLTHRLLPRRRGRDDT